MSEKTTTTTVWKLGIVAALASCYLLTWRAITGSMTAPPVAGPTAETVEADVPTPVTGESPGAPATVWIDQLPPAQRPAVTIPPGWQLAARTRPTPASTIAVPPSAPRLVQAPPRRRVRIRTRSS